MSDNITPREALQRYRVNSPPEIVEQADRFTCLNVAEQLELLFYITMHHGQQLISICDDTHTPIAEIGEVSKN